MLIITLILSLFLFYSIIGHNNEELYNQLISEMVTEDYCQSVISNLTSLIDQGYIYSDFLKAPKQPEGYPNYTSKVDLISELNNINKTNRTFYDFYRDIINIKNKAKDIHLDMYLFLTPNQFNLYFSRFCIPFDYNVVSIKDENSKVTGAYLAIEIKNFCKEGYSNDTLNRIEKLSENKTKISEINGMNPYEYFDKLCSKGIRSVQGKYISILKEISDLPVYSYPYKKEELNFSIKFEGEDESLNLDYQFYQINTDNSFSFNPLENFKNMKARNFGGMSLFHLLEKNLDKLKGKKFENNNEINLWNLTSSDGSIKCKIDEENQMNVLYQNSFFPLDFDDYENVMNECFSKFYSNKYKIVIIEDSNSGGLTELCFPFQQYIFPKLFKPQGWNMKRSELNKEIFFQKDEILNIDTCKTYTEKDNVLDGEEDIYGDGIIHNKTKKILKSSIFEMKIMERKRKEYLKGYTKKPTEILIFTDGYSLSCTSIVIKGLQANGVGIMVGYNSRPDLIENKFEASISNSMVELYTNSKYTQNLIDLGFVVSIAYSESFDQNDFNEPKIPMEFLVYPIDENVKIFSKYDDSLYNQFIDEAKIIFNKYNELENSQCNPDNKYLYYEIEDCDKKLNIEHAHGGYICGSDGKWNKSKCIAAYCDVGFILNDERTKCEEDPCEKFILNEISFRNSKNSKFIIEPDKVYIFKNFLENTPLNVYTIFDKPLIYKYNLAQILEPINSSTPINEKDILYANFYMNISDSVTIYILQSNNSKIPETNENDYQLSTFGLILIIIGVLLIISTLICIIVVRIKKTNDLLMDDIDNNLEPLKIDVN